MRVFRKRYFLFCRSKTKFLKVQSYFTKVFWQLANKHIHPAIPAARTSLWACRLMLALWIGEFAYLNFPREG